MKIGKQTKQQCLKLVKERLCCAESFVAGVDCKWLMTAIFFLLCFLFFLIICSSLAPLALSGRSPCRGVSASAGVGHLRVGGVHQLSVGLTLHVLIEIDAVLPHEILRILIPGIILSDGRQHSDRRPLTVSVIVVVYVAVVLHLVTL